MGHASITVTAHTYADLDDDELDDVASGAGCACHLQDRIEFGVIEKGHNALPFAAACGAQSPAGQ